MTLSNSKIKLTGEQVLFFVITLLHLFPILSVPIFPTLDGGCHVYNAHVLKEFLFGNKEFYEEFHGLNYLLLPNVSGHFLMVFFQFFTSDLWSEKLLQIIYVILMAYSFRYMSVAIYPGKKILSYLGFTLIYSFLFHLGFYNYCFSLVFFFLAFGFWLRHTELTKYREKIILGLLLILVFLSHIFTLVLLLTSIGLLIIFELVTGSRKIGFKNSFSTSWRKILQLVLVSVPILILTGIYLFKFAGTGIIEYESLQTKFWDICHGRYLIAFNRVTEKPYTMMMAGFFILLFSISLFLFLKRKTYKHELSFHDGMILLAFFYGIIYIIIPESMASGEFMTTRMELMFFIIIILGSGGAFELFGKNNWLLLIVPLILNFMLYRVKYDAIKGESNLCFAYYKTGSVLPQNTVVVPLHNSGDWFIGHFPSYLGLDKQVLILDNYEAGRKYFPMIWKQNKSPEAILGDYTGPEICVDISNYEKHSGSKIDFVAFWNRQPSANANCPVDINAELADNFAMIYNKEGIEIFQRTNNVNHKQIAGLDFEFLNQPGVIDSISHSGKKSFAMVSTPETQFSPTVMETVERLGIKENSIVEASGFVFPFANSASTKFVFMIERNHKAYIYKEEQINAGIKIREWNKVKMTVTLNNLQGDDLVKLYFWQVDGPPTIVDDLNIHVIN